MLIDAFILKFKFMIKKSILALTLLMFGITQAQIVQNMSDTGMVIFTKNKEPDTFTGSPYMEDEFKPGKLIDDKGRSADVFLRYHALEDVVVVKTEANSDEEYMLPKLTSITYELKDYTYFIDNLRTDNGNIEAYFARFFEGENSSFVGRPEIDVIPAQKANTGYEKDKPADIDVEMVYYISIDGGIYKEVRLKERDLEDLFTSDKMETYFDKHKIKKEKDVVEMLKFYENNI